MEDTIAFGASAGSSRPRHNLPVPLTALVGREQEYMAILARLADPTCRLISVTGVGGVGKTRLALEAARAVAPVVGRDSRFLDGAYLVPLVLLTEQSSLDDALVATIAATLGLIFSGPDPLRIQLRNYLSEKAMLLLLDSVEQLQSSAPLIEWLLESAPQLQIMATSRVPLGIHGEWVLALDGLSLPTATDATAIEPASYAAIDLFLRSAQVGAPGLALGSGDIAAIAQICRMVGGLPLGIELAASWARFMSCREIAGEIAHSLDFLSAAGNEQLGRHQSMRAVFTSTWVLLTEAEQRAVRRLAIFAGSFTRAAAGAVSDTALPMLATLVSKSLVRRLAGAEGSETRYALPETLRPYAVHELEHSGELQDLADRHATFYLSALAAQSVDLAGPRQSETLAALSAEIAQIRAAWRQAITRADSVRIGAAADALFQIYNMRSWFGEGAEVFGAARQAIALVAQSDPVVRIVWARLLAREGWMIFQLGRQIEARALIEQSLVVLSAGGAVADQIWARNYLGAVCAYLGDYITTERLCRENLVLSEAHGDLYGRVVSLSVLCQTAYDRGDYVAARTWGEESLNLERQIGSPWSMAFSLANLGKVAAALGDYQRAEQVSAQALEIRRMLGDSRGAAICLTRMGDASAQLGNLHEAVDRYRASLTIFREIGNRWGIASALINLGRLALNRRADQAAARMLGEALALALDMGSAPQVATATSAITQLSERSGGWAPTNSPRERRATASVIPPDPAAALQWANFYGAMVLEQALTQLVAALEQPVLQSVSTTPAPRSTTLPDGLTAREVEVLQLVASGLTDAQVADRLIISRRTVNAHLASIYSKIGMNTRSAATRYAIEQGLL